MRGTSGSKAVIAWIYAIFIKTTSVFSRLFVRGGNEVSNRNRSNRARGISVVTMAMLLVVMVPAVSQAQIVQADRWMKELAAEYPAAMDQTLAEFIFPGSHDAGTYNLKPLEACVGCAGAEKVGDFRANACPDIVNTINNYLDMFDPLGIVDRLDPDNLCFDEIGLPGMISTFFIPWSRAQGEDMLGQLNRGSRVFDLRFFKAVAADANRSSGLLTEGAFYIHHTLVGPDSAEILSGVEAFLADPAHSGELIFLNFNAMQETGGTPSGGNPEGSTPNGMSNASLLEFYEDVFTRLGQYMAPRSLGDTAKVSDILAAGHQIIVSGPELTCPSDVPCPFQDLQDLIWPNTSNGSSSFAFNTGYPEAQDWDTEAKLFEFLKELAAKRIDTNKMFRANVAMGTDLAIKIVLRSFICGLDTLNASGLCTAINDDWDEFQSLGEVASWTNSKILSALVGLPRDQVNFVLADFFPAEFAAEAKKLNMPVARAQVVIERVDYISGGGLEGANDFYPRVQFSSTQFPEWPEWGGRYLEIKDNNNIAPGWRATRSVPAGKVLNEVFVIITDEDDVSDDVFDINPDPDEDQLILTLPIALCVNIPGGCQRIGNSRGDSGDIAAIRYAWSVCAWEDCDPLESIAPMANDDQYDVVEGSVLTVAAQVGVLFNDSDPEGGALVVSSWAPAIHGRFIINPDGSFIYEPDENYCGEDSFTYIATQAEPLTPPALDSSPATVNITVHCVNDAPVATDDRFFVLEDGSINGNVIGDDNGFGIDTDVDGDGVSIASFTNTTHGFLLMEPATGGFSYSPNDDYCGPDSFTYTLTDETPATPPTMVSNTATVSIIVNCVNDLPVVSSVIPASQTIDQRRDFGPVIITVDDVDDIATSLTASNEPPYSEDSLSLSLIACTVNTTESPGENGSTCQWSYQGWVNYDVGEFNILFTSSDNGGESQATGSFALTVLGVPIPTMSRWGMLILMLMLGGMGMYWHRTRSS